MSNYGENERPSWSEIDKLKDRGGAKKKAHRDDAHQNYSDRRTVSKYKQALENLFDPGKKQSKPKVGKLKKLHEISDRAEFIKKADEYLAEQGLPTAWEDLETFLRHKDPKVLSETITAMEKLMDEQSETRIGNFQKDLNLIQMTTRDRELRKQVTKLLHKIEPKS